MLAGRKNAAAYDRARDVGIARDVADNVPGRGHVGSAGLDGIHGIAADNVISDRVGSGASDGVVVNSNVLACRAADKDPSETGSVPVPPLLIVIVPMLLLLMKSQFWKTEIEDPVEAIVLAAVAMSS